MIGGLENLAWQKCELEFLVLLRKRHQFRTAVFSLLQFSVDDKTINSQWIKQREIISFMQICAWKSATKKNLQFSTNAWKYFNIILTKSVCPPATPQKCAAGRVVAEVLVLCRTHFSRSGVWLTVSIFFRIFYASHNDEQQKKSNSRRKNYWKV